jgi:5'-nucleotidase
MTKQKNILLTNDDGYMSAGIVRLREALSSRYRVTVVAPDRERSAISMALTLHHPLRIEQAEADVFAVDGTPADCVNLAMQKLLAEPPDFVVSGMNLGENLGEDVLFSGTVGGAFTGFLYGVPSLAVSLIPRDGEYGRGEYDLEAGAGISLKILNKLMDGPAQNVVYNVNIPNPNDGAIHLTTLGSKRYSPTVVEKGDPRGKKYYWIGTGEPSYNGGEGTDIWAVRNGHVSLGLIQYDLNCPGGIEALQGIFDED